MGEVRGRDLREVVRVLGRVVSILVRGVRVLGRNSKGNRKS